MGQAARRVGVITDSSTCLPAGVACRLGIGVLPVRLHLPGSDGVDGSDHISSRIAQALEQDRLVRSSRPFVTDYLAAVEGAEADGVVIVTPAVEFTGMYSYASLAAELATRPAAVVDSRTAAAGQALVVIAGAEAAAAGASLEDVVKVVEDASRLVDVVASLETLVPIQRGRRVPAQALAGAELQGMRSVFRMRGGTVQPLRATSTVDQALETVANEWKESTRGDGERVMVFHGDCPELAERLRATIGHVDFVSGFSGAMQIHTGRGVVGASWLRLS
jgi:DegV family protein with EDD domain